jgi:hypothetical protein
MKFISTLLLIATAALAQPPAQQCEVEKVVADYVGLYKRETLERWRELFHPKMTASHAAEDGTIRVRALDEFYESQRKGFEEDPTMHETLSNVKIAMGKRMARVTADYVFTSEGKPGGGKLGLHLVEGKGGWKIVGVVFSYDE